MVYRDAELFRLTSPWRGKSQRKATKFRQGGRHDRLHRGLGAYALRQARRRDASRALSCRSRTAALADAGIEAKDVDEIVLGHFNAGFSAQDFTASLVLQASPDLRFKRALRVENACATGSAAVHQGLKSIAAKSARIVLVVGVEQMTTTPGPEIGKNLLKASYVREEADIEGGFAGIFGKIAGLYFQRWGDQSDALAMIAAKNHKNGVGNPYAQLRKDLGFEFCRNVSDKNPFVAGPLKRTDCSLVSDGAAAVVLADVETALQLKQGDRVPRDRACAGLPADDASATSSSSKAAARPGSARWRTRALRSAISRWSRRTTASPSPS